MRLSCDIYNLKCKTCDKVYVCQTCRELETRTLEHHRCIKENKPNSAFAVHILNNVREYGSLLYTVKFIETYHSGGRMKCCENLYSQLYQNQEL